MSDTPAPRVLRLPAWAPRAALALSLVLAWLNFLTTSRWASLPGALNGWKQPWYAAALAAATLLAMAAWRRVGHPVRLGRPLTTAVLVAGAGSLLTALFCRLPPDTWTQLPFKDNWAMLLTQAVNGIGLLSRGVVVGWNWWFLGGYPTSTDIAQNFSTVALLPIGLFGPALGYHVLHLLLYLAVPAYVWWDIAQDDGDEGRLAAGFACLFAAGYSATVASSGDTNSLVGVACAGLALVGSRAARLGRRWGGPVLLAGLTLAACSHTAFFVYAGLFLTVEALYFRDRTAFARLAAAGAIAALSSLPVHWESLRYRDYVSFNNTVYDPSAPIRWDAVARTIALNIEILALPHRWFNDYRSLANVWLPALLVAALWLPRSRAGFYAWTAVLAQALLRLNSPSMGGALFDRIQHMFPLIAAPALAGFVLRAAGTPRLAAALVATIGLYVATSLAPVRHVSTLRDFDPPLVDRIAASDGALVLVELSPHRDMDSDPVRRTPTTPFDVHFEALLPRLAGQRFYSQMIDGWGWSVFRGQVVGAGTFQGQPIAETPHDAFAAEMGRWGVRHLFVWTDATRQYLAADPRYVERWRGGRWSHFERAGADVRQVVTPNGHGDLRKLDFLGAEVVLQDVRAGDPVVVRANFYPAWRARADGAEVPLFASDRQLAFRAPRDGSYVVRLEYPRYRWLTIPALTILIGGLVVLSRWPRAPSR
jgi:hypothetical protein